MTKNHDEKSPVKIRIIGIEGQDENNEIGTVKILWERGEINGTTKSFQIGEEINEEFGFTSTFQFRGGILKEKTFKLSVLSKNVLIGSVPMNLSL